MRRRATATLDEVTGTGDPAHVRWRAGAIDALGLQAGARAEAATPLPGFDAVAAFAQRHVALAGGGRVVVLSARLGGFAAALVPASTDVVAVEPDAGTAGCAAHLFPELRVVRAHPSRPGVRTGSADAVVVQLVGTRSASVLNAARRACRAGGRIVVVELRVEGRHRPDRLAERLGRAGMVVDEWAVASATAGSGFAAGDDVSHHIATRHRNAPSFERWIDSRRRAERLLATGGLVVVAAAAVVAPFSPRRRA